MSENTPRAVPGVAGFFFPPTLDKTLTDRKHLTTIEVEKLLAAIFNFSLQFSILAASMAKGGPYGSESSETRSREAVSRRPDRLARRGLASLRFRGVYGERFVRW
jgi:hypothetical protein